MPGPKAPEDPAARGSSFYICRQKDIEGGTQPDGSGIQFIYLNDARLTTFARIVGNITDECMLGHLKTADGFREMVAGIGVSVESENREQEITFAFQMYARPGSNQPGTTITAVCRPDGMEQILWLDDYEWLQNDDLPGQIRFHFEKAEALAVADVKLYLRDGFTAPEQEECTRVDFESREYQQIRERSLLQLGSTQRLKRLLERARAGEEVTLAFIGGSITQGAGAIPIHRRSYAYQTYVKFKDAFGQGENVRFIKAGVGGTPSELGMVRLERDVLREETVVPDLVVVEFAVNDEGDETKGLCYESLVRRLLSLSEQTAVVLLFSVFADDWNLQERLSPVGERYRLPMVSIRDAVVEQFYRKNGEGRVLSKSQFFYDSYHPSNNGHTIMSDCLMYLLEQADREPDSEAFCWQEAEPVFGTTFTGIHLLDKHTHAQKPLWIEPGSFSEVDTRLQAVERDEEFAPTPQFPYNWQHRSGREPFRMKISCKALVLVSKDSERPDAGKAEVRVDGHVVKTVDPKEVGWTHCNAQILFSDTGTGEHIIEIAMAEGDEDKLFTILGFGYVE